MTVVGSLIEWLSAALPAALPRKVAADSPVALIAAVADILLLHRTGWPQEARCIN